MSQPTEPQQRHAQLRTAAAARALTTDRDQEQAALAKEVRDLQFASFFRENYLTLIRFLRIRIDRDGHVRTADAEDIAAITMQKMYLNWEKIESPKPFMFTLATRTLIDLYRKEIRGGETALTEDAVEFAEFAAFARSPWTEDPVKAAMMEEYLARATSRMSSREKLVFHRRVVEGFSSAEVADMLGISPKSAQNIYERTRVKAQMALQDAGLVRRRDP